MCNCTCWNFRNTTSYLRKNHQRKSSLWQTPIATVWCRMLEWRINNPDFKFRSPICMKNDGHICSKQTSSESDIRSPPGPNSRAAVESRSLDAAVCGMCTRCCLRHPWARSNTCGYFMQPTAGRSVHLDGAAAGLLQYGRQHVESPTWKVCISSVFVSDGCLQLISNLWLCERFSWLVWR